MGNISHKPEIQRSVFVCLFCWHVPCNVIQPKINHTHMCRLVGCTVICSTNVVIMFLRNIITKFETFISMTLQSSQVSMAWCKATFTGNSYISWENPMVFAFDFPLNHSIDSTPSAEPLHWAVRVHPSACFGNITRALTTGFLGLRIRYKPKLLL